MKNFRSFLVKIFSFIIIIIIFYILIDKLYTHIYELSSYQIEFRKRNFILSIIFLLLCYIPIPYIWHLILKDFGVNLSYKRCFQIQYISGLGRYLPGKIWIQVAQVYLAKKEDIPIRITLISNLFLLLLRTLGGIYIFLLTFFLWEDFSLFYKLLITFSVFLGSYLLLRSAILEKIIEIIFKRLSVKKEKIEVNFKRVFQKFTFLILSWIIAGIGYYFLFNSIFIVGLKNTIIMLGMHAISSLVGYYAIIFPGGLGITEGAFVFLLSRFYPLSFSIVISLACRLWYTLGEIIVSTTALGWAKIFDRR